MSDYETILVAFVVEGTDTKDRQQKLMSMLPKPGVDGSPLDCWWIAEDKRYDNSDNDSAIFVPKGTQQWVTEFLGGYKS